MGQEASYASEMPTQDELMTAGDVAKLIGVTPATVRVWADTGRLQVQRTSSGTRLFIRHDVERFAADRLAAETSE